MQNVPLNTTNDDDGKQAVYVYPGDCNLKLVHSLLWFIHLTQPAFNTSACDLELSNIDANSSL